MKFLAPLAAAATIVTGAANAQHASFESAVPALSHYGSTVVQGDLWKRPGLSARDRSIVTVATLIAREQTALMPEELARALDNGVKPSELSGIVTHLAFYAGWGNAAAAADALAPIYETRGIPAESLPGAEVEQLPLNQEAEDAREAGVQANHAETSIGVVDYTRDVLFRDLWLRSDLAARDRSLVTVTALVAVGQAEQVPFHLGRAMDNGLTRDEASEALTQLAFYAGWPRVFSAMPVFRSVFDARPTSE
ncbi:carboxymuconolactone decarboxylase family protein [Kaistia terrae]|uniref:Carboxymuconolactone decarboxylase family protein n=1 Tax=Kaistia terrae TaxID=537017 RepID=A0ABW0Q3R2_9HYPH|nr:carboxymuconolactone decarboxylase family protein [Kaistia terrae]MCX5581188.1 carboxymuconolactone decarboxylase family protein [Kaistia terrae]